MAIFRAMLGSTEIGAARVAEALSALPGQTRGQDYLDGILRYAERLVLDEIAACVRRLPRRG